MSAEFHELVRAMELACYRTNPPHQPAIAPLSLADLGADILADQLQKPEWQYAYLRGIEEKAANLQTTAADALACPSRSTDTVIALATLTDGRIVSGGGNNTLRVWREGGGTWHSAELDRPLRILSKPSQP